MKLYFIATSPDVGSDFDLFVWATSRAEAVSLWIKYWDEEELTGSDILDVFLVPRDPPTEPKALRWHLAITAIAE